MHCNGHGQTFRLADTTNRHAKMFGDDDDSDCATSPRGENVDQSVTLRVFAHRTQNRAAGRLHRHQIAIGLDKGVRPGDGERFERTEHSSLHASSFRVSWNATDNLYFFAVDCPGRLQRYDITCKNFAGDDVVRQYRQCLSPQDEPRKSSQCACHAKHDWSSLSLCTWNRRLRSHLRPSKPLPAISSSSSSGKLTSTTA